MSILWRVNAARYVAALTHYQSIRSNVRSGSSMVHTISVTYDRLTQVFIHDWDILDGCAAAMLRSCLLCVGPTMCKSIVAHKVCRTEYAFSRKIESFVV